MRQNRNSGLYPITCLNTLKKNEKQALLNKNIVLCKQLYFKSNRDKTKYIN